MLADMRAGGERRMRLARIFILLCFVGSAHSQAPTCSTSDSFCDVPDVIVSPADKSVFRVDCTCGTTITCPTVSFHVVYLKSALRPTNPVVISTQTAVEADSSFTCNIPLRGVFTDSSTNAVPCGAKAYALEPEGIPQGYGVTRLSVKPSAYSTDFKASSICFNAVTTGGANMAVRCIYYQVAMRPQALIIAVEGGTQITERAFGLGTKKIPVDLGTELRLRFVSFHRVRDEPLQIDLRTFKCPPPSAAVPYSCPSPELPNQRWEGETKCTGANTTAASITMANVSKTCEVQLCERTLLYRPQLSENGKKYFVSFQSLTPKIDMVQPIATSVGTACGAALGACDPGPYVSEAGTDYEIIVRESKPEFLSGYSSRPLFLSPGVPVTPLAYSFGGTPADNTELALAFINCPITNFGVYAKKLNSKFPLTISLQASEPGQTDAAALGLDLTPQYFISDDPIGDNPAQAGSGGQANYAQDASLYGKNSLCSVCVCTHAHKHKYNMYIYTHAHTQQQQHTNARHIYIYIYIYKHTQPQVAFVCKY
jgi:hypothetical protein